MNWIFISEAFGAVFALAATVLSLYIMASVKRGASVWVYIGITSLCMFFAMLLGITGLMFPVDQEIQRLEQYIFLMAGALSFAISGIELHKMFEYKER